MFDACLLNVRKVIKTKKEMMSQANQGVDRKYQSVVVLIGWPINSIFFKQAYFSKVRIDSCLFHFKNGHVVIMRLYYAHQYFYHLFLLARIFLQKETVLAFNYT